MGGNQPQNDLVYRQSHEFTTRHITPQICVSVGGKSTGSSAATSRTTSRLSGASSVQVNSFSSSQIIHERILENRLRFFDISEHICTFFPD